MFAFRWSSCGRKPVYPEEIHLYDTVTIASSTLTPRVFLVRTYRARYKHTIRALFEEKNCTSVINLKHHSIYITPFSLFLCVLTNILYVAMPLLLD